MINEDSGSSTEVYPLEVIEKKDYGNSEVQEAMKKEFKNTN